MSINNLKMPLSKARKYTNIYIKEILRDKHFETVLNLGCGNDADKEGGYYSSYFIFDNMIKIDPRTDIKIYPEEVKNNGSVIKHIVCGGENMPLKSNSIDFLMMLRVFNKFQSSDSEKIVDDPLCSESSMLRSARTIWKECLRVLSKDSEILVTYSDNYGDHQWLADCRKMISKDFIPKEIFRFETSSDMFKGNKVSGKIVEIFYGTRKTKGP
jgi:hypothetical protein